MKVQRSPHAGYTADPDMSVYWTGVLDGDSFAQSSIVGDHGELLTSLDRASPTQTPSLFAPLLNRSLTFAPASENWLETDAVLDYGYHQGAVTSTVGWAAAFWYDLGSAATQCVLELSASHAPSNSFVAASPFRIFWLGQQNRFAFRSDVGTVGSTISVDEVLSEPVPTRGWFGLSATRRASDGRMIVSMYSSLLNGGKLSEDVIDPVPVANGTTYSSGSTRWLVGASARHGTSFTSLRFPLDGKLEEISVWKGTRTDSKMRAAYGACLQPWDEHTLLESNTYVTRYRVLLEDDDGVFQDMSNFDGKDWTQSVEIQEGVDDPTSTAKVSLRRRFGRYADASPLNTEPPYAGLVQLRRRVIIERAFVPTLWRMQGWEWRRRWSGFIDSWSATDDELNLNLSDETAPLNDTQIFEARAYTFAVSNKMLEEHQQQIIDDYEPRLRRRNQNPTTIGYKGGTKPVLYTEAGSTFTAQYLPSNFRLRYNDVGAGSVLDALQVVCDQIGADCRLLQHDSSDSARLTTFDPKRNYGLPLASSSGVNPTVTTKVPHGLGIGSTVTLSGTASNNFGGRVASVLGPMQFTVKEVVGAPVAGSVSTGTLHFGYNLALRTEQIEGSVPVDLDISRIRNHAVVRFNRNSSTATSPCRVEYLGDGTIKATMHWLPNVDPDNNGFIFTLTGGTGAATPFNVSLSGRQTGSAEVTSYETVPGIATVGFTADSMVFESPYLSHREVVSTSTPSIEDYGMLPVAVYEGTALAINTEEEALRLADAMISDLSEPQMDTEINTKPLPLGLHDVLLLPEAPKGQWTGTLTAAIVSVKESCSGGKCSATYGIRHSRPSRGSLWTERIRVGGGNGGFFTPPANNPYFGGLPTLTARDARAVQIRVPPLIGNNTGLRHDRFEFYISTKANFRPEPIHFAGSGRDNTFNMRELTPGTMNYVRYASRDIYGTLSPLTGLTTASGNDIPGFVPRFVDTLPTVMAVSVSPATVYAAGFLGGSYRRVDVLKRTDASDPAQISHDTYGNYNTSSCAFQVPASGEVGVTARLPFRGDPAKVPLEGDAWEAWGAVRHMDGSGNLKGLYEAFVDGDGASSLYFVDLNKGVFCSSGDWLAVDFKAPGSNGIPVINTTATISHAYAYYTLRSQAP